MEKRRLKERKEKKLDKDLGRMRAEDGTVECRTEKGRIKMKKGKRR